IRNALAGFPVEHSHAYRLARALCATPSRRPVPARSTTSGPDDVSIVILPICTPTFSGMNAIATVAVSLGASDAGGGVTITNCLLSNAGVDTVSVPAPQVWIGN